MTTDVFVLFILFAIMVEHTLCDATSVHGGEPGQSCYIIAQGSAILRLHVLKHYGPFSIKSELNTKWLLLLILSVDGQE